LVKIERPGAGYSWFIPSIKQTGCFSGVNLLLKPSIFINQPMGIWDVFPSLDLGPNWLGLSRLSLADP